MREIFTTERQLEFFSENELSVQIGYSKPYWGIILLKELIDNALDACESKNILPEITINLDSESFSIQDNATGLPESVLDGSLNYGVRVSDKMNYISPSRGQQGNALKTLWAAPLVVDGNRGIVDVATKDYAHQIMITLDRIEQKPKFSKIELETKVQNGTFIKVHSLYLSRSVSNLDYGILYDGILLIQNFALWNPHATFNLYQDGSPIFLVTRQSESVEKWIPDNPTSPWWYSPEDMCKLISGLILNDRKKGRAATIREFVSNFVGLSRSAKQKIIGNALLPSKGLEDLVIDGNPNLLLVEKLLSAMQQESKPVLPKSLGVIGKVNLANILTKNFGANPELTTYSKIESKAEQEIPYIVEVVLGYLEPNKSRKILCGLNFSPVLELFSNDIFWYLENCLIDKNSPVVIAIHIVCPKFSFTDRGKSKVVLSYELKESLQKAITTVSKDWTKQQKHRRRNEKATERELIELTKANKTKPMEGKEAAYSCMEKAYLIASSNGKLPANARQIMYAARPTILKLTEGKELKTLAKSFTSKYLPSFMADFPELTKDWNVAYDPRGNLIEPHTNVIIPLGTLKVRNYVESWSSNTSITCGHKNRFNTVLFIEKEGFDHTLEAAKIRERYDIAIMSTKGQSTTAARELIERFSEDGIKILVAHDFDKSGFSIYSILQNDNERYQYKTRPNLVDIGLRLTDIEEMGLQSEPVIYDSDPRANLKQSGCTPEEIKFLARQDRTGQWVGDRVELNAMSSEVFISWLEKTFVEHGVKKFVPETEVLEDVVSKAIIEKLHARKLIEYDQEVQKILLELGIKKPEIKDIPMPTLPEDLRQQIIDVCENNRTLPWDVSILNLVNEEVSKAQELEKNSNNS